MAQLFFAAAIFTQLYGCAKESWRVRTGEIPVPARTSHPQGIESCMHDGDIVHEA